MIVLMLYDVGGSDGHRIFGQEKYPDIRRMSKKYLDLEFISIFTTLHTFFIIIHALAAVLQVSLVTFSSIYTL